MNDIQKLLDEEARLSNERYRVLNQIKFWRGNTPPTCWGDDDCSIEIMSRCPWRIDCVRGSRNKGE